VFLVQAWFVPGTSGWNIPTWTLSALIVAYALFPMVWRRVAAAKSPLNCWPWASVAYLAIDYAALMAFGSRLPAAAAVRPDPGRAAVHDRPAGRSPAGHRSGQPPGQSVGRRGPGAVIGIQALGNFDHFSLALLGFLIYAAGASKPKAWRWAGAAGRLSFSLFLTNTLTAVVWFGVVRAVEQKIGLPRRRAGRCGRRPFRRRSWRLGVRAGRGRAIAALDQGASRRSRVKWRAGHPVQA
jgi:hypothetical protein